MLTLCRVKAFDVQTCPIPASSDVFLRVWKHECTTSESRVELLRKCGALKLQSMFKINLPGQLLSDILIVLDTMPFTSEDSMQVEPQGYADSQQILAQADGMHSRDVQFIVDIMKALQGGHAVVQTSALMEPCWSERICFCIRDRQICSDSKTDQPCSKESC